MADAIISPLSDRLIGIIAQQIQNEINLVTGVEKEIQKLSDQLRTVRTVLDDAERRGFKDQERAVRDWLKRLETACCEMDDVLDEWYYNILRQQMEKKSNASAASKHKVCSFLPSPSACLSFEKVSFRHRVGKKIKQAIARLVQILNEKSQYGFTIGKPTYPSGGSWRAQSTSFVEVESVCGRNNDKDILMTKLMPKNVSKETSGIQVISIVGVGGIGKTTLAQLVCNESQVKECYPLRIWICVSDPFDPAMIANWIVQKAGGSSSNTSNQLDMMLAHLKEAIEGKKFLLVLDDVWTEDFAQWDPLRIILNFGAAGSKVLVTTRNERVASMMGTTENGIHRPGLLSNDDCWLLLSRIAFFDRSEHECQSLKEIGREIADRCKGLPLAAKVMGSLLRFKHGVEGWKSVLHSETWQFEKKEDDIFRYLLLSYNELTPVLKRCFSYCAIFPKDYVINVEEDLIQNWLALGYLGSDKSAFDLEVRGREYFDNLAMRSLFQELDRAGDPPNSTITRCKMHDIVHDFAQFVRNTSSSKATCEVCHSMVSHVKEYRSLTLRGSVPYVCDCLISSKVLHFQSHFRSWETAPKDIYKLIHLRKLSLVGLRELLARDMKLICKLYNLKFLILSQCNIEEVPMEIGNLIGLRKLDLSRSSFSKELPERIGDLHELRSLNLQGCESLCGLPQGMNKLTKLKHLYITGAFSGIQYPDEVIGQLSGLQTLKGFRGKLSSLKKLNQLSGYLELRVPKISSGEDVSEARGAELIKKVQLDHLHITFGGGVGENAGDQVLTGVVDALEPHPNLSYLKVWNYKGSKLPDWICSPINQLKHIQLRTFNNLTLLPALGKLPCLEQLEVSGFSKLEFVGRNFLGITEPPPSSSSQSSSSSSLAIGFPKLETLIFHDCKIWKEWENITAEEEASTVLSLFPCFKQLTFAHCESLNTLPHRLLRKAPVLESLQIYGCGELQGRHDKRRDTSSWKYISHIPRGFIY